MPQHLIQAGLFWTDLLPVNSPVLVQRYNEGLINLGLSPTELKSFRIDALGWSPEIAEERGELSYLCQDPANPAGIVLFPEQRRITAYQVVNSYELELMRRYHATFQQQIADITTLGAIAVLIDDGLTHYNHISDLLLIDYAIARSVLGEFSKVTREQQRLVREFMESPAGWRDQQLRQALMESGQRYGDLRYRQAQIPEFRFDHGSFYTTAFGGVFVLRKPKGSGTLLVVGEGQEAINLRQAGLDLLAITDSGLIDRLYSEGFLTFLSTEELAQLDGLAGLKRNLEFGLLAQNFPDLKFSQLSDGQLVRQAAHLTGPDRALLVEFERFVKGCERHQPTHFQELSPRLQAGLCRPHPDLEPSQAAVVQQLLYRLWPYNIREIYRNDKSYFIRQYLKWPEEQRKLVVKQLLE